MTIQVPEKVLFEKLERISNDFSILKINPSHPDIQELEMDYPFQASCLKRSYAGTWELQAGQLYLVDLKGAKFKKAENKPIFASWINGSIDLLTNEKCVLNNHEEVYYQEHYVTLTFESGYLMDISYNRGLMSKEDFLAQQNKRVETEKSCTYKEVKQYLKQLVVA
ncbi:hypothetical protein [Vibrio maerlii]|uniref:hypothetical protein n=1 Tax=Vibrio maerlii TaxID=2231648 RepID=UPI000E3D6009|nr:hypothetical protein [Vibrio maerlii]